MLHLFEPESLEGKVDRPTIQIFKMFAQTMLNRIYVGQLRYGSPDRKKRYASRLYKEVEAYRSTGNAEHLLNITNYCVLEWIAPEHKLHHFDATVESVTRKEKE